eukprot:Seg846.3 transcript_id=Seg846.3/GoldUCD/mRNA.D3Y31 product="NADH-cytochrome b5 reductase-like" protein_id=Seg846.3/GoldUCD/D3Y31
MDFKDDDNENNEMFIANEMLPEPEEPLSSDCCGSGCSPCVFDIYERDLEIWRNECKNLVVVKESNVLCKETNGPSLSCTEYTLFELLSITKINDDAMIYRFMLPGQTSLNLHAGQHLLLRSKLNGKCVTRAYTPISSLSQEGHFDVMIKIYPDGLMSQCVSNWTVGDMIEWRGPFGKFVYKGNEYKTITMLAAGTGIAPMLQVIQNILDDENDETIIKLIYSCKKPSDILLKDRLDEYRCFWNFHVIYCLTQMRDDDQTGLKYGDVILQQRIDQDLLSKHLPEPSKMSKVLICGTKSFDKDMINFVMKVGYEEDDIFRF